VAGLFFFFLFWLAVIGFSVFAVLFSTLCVLAPNPVLALTFMLCAILNSLVLLFLNGEELMALIFLTVYVGAISILFLFVAIFINPESPRLRLALPLPVAAATLILLFATLEPVLLLFDNPKPALHFQFAYLDFVDALGSSSLFYQFGILLFKYYYFSTILVALILFAAMIGAILLAFPAYVRGGDTFRSIV
jgi:NADH-quinone oxidoreductase subunit J